jgi:hypothetical protein
MFKTILLLSFFIFKCNAVCFNLDTINTSKSLFTYNNNVYDITNYKHPGGSIIKKTIGTDLNTFLLIKKYKFHLKSKDFYKDLDKILVGNICDSTTPTYTSTTPTYTSTALNDTTPTDTSTTPTDTSTTPTDTSTTPTDTSTTPTDPSTTLNDTTPTDTSTDLNDTTPTNTSTALNDTSTTSSKLTIKNKCKYNSSCVENSSIQIYNHISISLVLILVISLSIIM